ncbi:MAG: molybdopterin biosynthesis protein [Proteobacteria bacterium]|nr:molybdopterin biosynthesis protein [Pseudomonadota bacterium]
MSQKATFERHVYLKLKSLAEAQAIFQDRLQGRVLGRVLGREAVPVTEVLGRVTAEPVFARFSSPSYHAAAMDGIAVRAESTYGASPDQPRTLTVGREAFFVNTGHALPAGTDAVIMIEQVVEEEEGRVRIESAAYPWQHVRKVGEDIVATEMILPQGCRLGPYEMGALAAGGVFEVPVWRRPRVVVIPTGSELVDLKTAGETDLKPGQVLEFNSIILRALAHQAGAEARVWDMVPDDYPAILEALRQAAAGDADLIIINAGSSAGSEDYTATAIEALGEVLVHGVTIMPGKPTILGCVQDKPVIGNPGYPVSAVISFEQFAQPLLCRLQGLAPPRRPEVEVIPSQPLPSKLGLEEFLRVKLGRIGQRVVAVPLPRGAGSITTLTRADGIVRVPAESEGIGREETARAELLRTPEELDGTIVVIGSHDNTLDVLGDLLRRRNPDLTLSSGNVGSLGGLLTLKRGFSHLAGSHLLDTETGEYNLSYIRQHLAGFPVRLVNLVTREQGFLVLPGNPKGIRTFGDLYHEGVTFINRQGGSGTRILLDYNLQLLGLAPDGISGYENEEFTHMAVAAAVLSGRADVGLAIQASAKALGLNFVPVTTERYDLVIPESHWEDPKIQAMLDVVRSDVFKTTVDGLGGYGTGQTGELLWQWEG